MDMSMHKYSHYIDGKFVDHCEWHVVRQFQSLHR